MELFNKEKIITEQLGLTVTNNRIQHIFRKDGKLQIKSIFLENLTSSEIIYISNTNYILYGIFCFIIFLVAGIILSKLSKEEIVLPIFSFIGVFMLVLFIISYFLDRKYIIKLSSPSATIEIITKARNYKEAIELVHIVEKAKQEKLN